MTLIQPVDQNIHEPIDIKDIDLSNVKTGNYALHDPIKNIVFNHDFVITEMDKYRWV